MAPSRRLIASLALVVAAGTTSVAAAQTSGEPPHDAAPVSAESAAAARVHREGGYPSDVLVLDDESETDVSGRGAGADGAGHGPTGRVGLRGDRDGGEAGRHFDFPMPDFVRQILDALSQLLGVAARPIGYVLLALGIAIVIALVVYLVVMMRLPRADLRTGLRRDAGGSAAPVLDPLLEGTGISAEEHAAAGRFREAIHELFLRALRDASHAGDVDRRGRTAREVVDLVGRAHGELPPLAALLALTELVWFGGRAATEAQYLEARGLAADVQARVHTLGPALPVGAPA